MQGAPTLYLGLGQQGPGLGSTLQGGSMKRVPVGLRYTFSVAPVLLGRLGRKTNRSGAPIKRPYYCRYNGADTGVTDMVTYTWQVVECSFNPLLVSVVHINHFPTAVRIFAAEGWF